MKQGMSGLHRRIYFRTVLIDTSVVNDEIFMSGFIIVHDKGSRVVVSYYKQTRFTNSHRSLVSKPIKGELSSAPEKLRLLVVSCLLASGGEGRH